MSTTPVDKAAWRLSDATNRAVRTAAQMGAILALVVVVDAVESWATGGPFAWRIVAGAAISALLAPFAALLHRLVLDPSRFPSATPPEPPSAPALVVHPVITVSGSAPSAITRTAPYFDFGNPVDPQPPQPGTSTPPATPAAVEALEHVEDIDLNVPPPPTAKARAAREEAAAEARQAKTTKKAAPAKKAAKKTAAARKRTG